ncbi:ATP-dependent DNA helicase [Ruminococcaceae bacterium OttesenSCG-928-D13]|nr:ATP-dependent DNA helicase [Ruminococcaceae bacterium OttesenSCG-928-D13]
MPVTATDICAREISYDMPPDIPPRFLTGGTPIFTAYGCALLERQTAKNHVYSAVNLTSGRREILYRKHRPLDESEHLNAAAKIRALPIAGAGRSSVDRPPREKLPRKKMDEILTKIFVDILPQHGYAMRKNQIGLAEHILETISRRAISLAESEVGTGKTMAYLAAAVLAKRGRLNDFWLCGHYPQQSYAETAYMPVVIATSSIALQRAIIQDYLPEFSNILMRHGVINTPLTCVIRKGREHFLCERRLQAFFDDSDAQTQSILHPLVSPSASCDLADAEGLTPFMKRKICVSGKCGDSCRHAASCRYLRYMQHANEPEVDFLICNHNYYLADVLHRNSGKRPLLPHYQLVIIDEAHKFLDAARQMYGVTLDESKLPWLAATIHSFTEGKSLGGVNIHRLAKKLEEQGKRLFGRLRINLPDTEDDEAERLPANLDADATRHLKTMAGIATDLITALADSHVHARHRERKAQAMWELENLKRRAAALRKHCDLVCWLEQPENDLTLASIPKNLDERLYTDIWSQGLPVILTSGTLSAGGDFTRMKHSLGLSRMREALIDETSQPSPFDYHRNVMLYFSDTVPFPDQQDKGYLLAVADEVQRLVTASHGHAAVLFTSYNAMGQVFSILSGRKLPFPMFRMGKRDTAALDNFKASGNGILFASGSFWEGIDIPGDALSMLIIVKLPFAVPDPIGNYEKTLYPDMLTYKNQVLVPDMLVKLKQGFGRLIRTEGDSGVCAILDSRARDGATYHDRVIAALPFCHTSSSIIDIQKFMADQKPVAYFK